MVSLLGGSGGAAVLICSDEDDAVLIANELRYSLLGPMAFPNRDFADAAATRLAEAANDPARLLVAVGTTKADTPIEPELVLPAPVEDGSIERALMAMAATAKGDIRAIFIIVGLYALQIRAKYAMKVVDALLKSAGQKRKMAKDERKRVLMMDDASKVRRARGPRKRILRTT